MSSLSPPILEGLPLQHLHRQFQDYERGIRVRNYRLCGLLASIAVLAGSSLDWMVYEEEGMAAFFPLRLGTVLTLLLIRIILGTDFGHHWHRLLGLGMAAPLMGSIAWMIYESEGAASPYYAGLNLIMLGAAILMRWPLLDSILVVIMTLVMYLAACYAHGPIAKPSIFYNNLYFLVTTAFLTTAGTWFYNKIRLTEFELRQRLDSSLEKIQEANSALADSYGQLEQSKSQLEETNTKLEENNKKLRELDEAKSRFFANVSHELRTPLTLLLAPIESLRIQGDSIAPDQRDDLLTTMHSNAMRLLKLINDLLDLVRLESGTIQIRRAPLALEDFVRGLANAAIGVAKDKRIHLSIDCQQGLGRVQADAEKLERICLNLLFNALKFTPSGGTVQLHVIRDGDWLRLEVRDSGVGIAPEDLPNIFSRFWQADTSSQRKYQGMGIGLSLVKEIAEAHGGSVSVESERGKGTTMAVILPYEEALDTTPEETEAESHDLPPEAQKEWISDLYRRAEMFPAMTSLQATLRPVEVGLGKRSKKPRLLIADDEPDMLRFLRNQLSETFDIIEAVDGHQAVEKAAQFLPDIILSDMMMPEKDGLQVCRELRQRTSTRTIPVVLLTARADEKTKIDCLTAGASDFLGKPFSLTELSVRLKNLTDSHLYQRELQVQKQRLEAALEQIKETEALLVRNEKLASLGRLSAGLIHEINNPLNYAKQALYVLRDTATKLTDADRPDFEDTLGDIENGVDRVARIISDLRGFSRTTSQVAGNFNVSQAVQTTLRFFSHAIKDGVEVTTDLPPYLEGTGDQNQFIQVLINLIQNALDAMAGKEYPEDQSRTLDIRAAEADGLITLRIRDNGPGIPADIMHNVFDPFFTTKDVGAGMGLGLSICHQIIAEHGGRILLDSIPGQFCEFTLEFPATASILEA
ncbi:phospho-acceptor domain-containing protein [Prosthecobacter fusiformis]|uniref:histidine kinase n=1 Tax=Prosthecobacter fusiformis TaxID=48464 RepID=A0A4R7RHV8_9BACT|nr:ATP-binding protein [Prosthecobacter fusiformis]TDU62471.1 phospho-acceptor domain-containing protein [Prosthecobacter fusiformis]